MKSKLALLVIFAVLVSVGAAFFLSTSKMNNDEADTTPATEALESFETPVGASEESNRCFELVKKIETISECSEKWSVFQEQFKGCEEMAPRYVIEGEAGLYSVKNIIFHLAQCFQDKKDMASAIAVFEKGLQLPDWEIEEGGISAPAHLQIRSLLVRLKPTSNPHCHNLATIEKTIKEFVQTSEPSKLETLIYGDESLDFFVMASDVGGPEAFSSWSQHFLEKRSSYNLAYSGKVGKKCFLVEGWEKEFYPWRGFCASQIGDKNCYYLNEIWAGIDITLEDFRQKKTSE